MSETRIRARQKSRFRPLLVVVLLLAVALVSSCSHLRYYSQAIAGGAEVLMERQPIERIVETGRYRAQEVSEERLDRFETILEIREFASVELGLPDNKSYRTFVGLDRPYVVWNVVAAPEFSVEPERWCFPIAGCVSYRGYFSEARAKKFGARLVGRGLDVSVGGVAAYSTLGWFADPVLSTFVDDPEPRLAGLIFHELAHQVAYAPGDTTFNESFATVVEKVGVRRWLDRRGRSAELESFLESQRDEGEFVELVLEYRSRLAELYGSASDEEEMRRSKALLIDQLAERYRELTGSEGPYLRWFERDLNNADFASIGDYHQLVPALERELAASGGDLAAFYQRVEVLAELTREERWSELGESEEG